MAYNARSRSVPIVTTWTIQSAYKKLKFDLVNIAVKTLVILELKNRVDSGGTAAREEALSKKFFAICSMIDEEQEIFESEGRKYIITKMLQTLGINKLEMYVGLLYGIHGKEATAMDDKKDGFYSRSKTMIAEYCAKKHASKIDFEESKLSFKKDGITVTIEMLYGDQVIAQFLKKDIKLDKIMESTFAQPWDDYWLALRTATKEISLLRQYDVNHMTEISKLIDKDPEFRKQFHQFCRNRADIRIIKSVTEYVKNAIDLSQKIKGDYQDQYLLDCLYAYAAYYLNKDKGNIIKVESEDLV